MLRSMHRRLALIRPRLIELGEASLRYRGTRVDP